MTGKERLVQIFNEEIIEERTESGGELYEVHNDRGKFGDEILLIRFLHFEENSDELLKDDIDELEDKFYDEETPNPWNIQLFWVYTQGNEPADDLRSKLENDTRFAIRRCVPANLLEDFLAPLEKALDKLDKVSNEFDRHELLQKIHDHDLGFLLDDITLEEAKSELKTRKDSEISGSTRQIDGQNPPREFIESTELGEFRPRANLRRLDAEPFTLLYGRNATGKTSLLDGTALGLVGQIRSEENRADAYDGLRLKLENHEEPLAKDPKSANNRVAEWFGYRPYGRQKKYVEFYRVNYLEAGAATRLIDSDSDLDVEETLRRFLFGEELTRARKLKDRLIDALESDISTKKTKIAEAEEDINRLNERRERLRAIFDDFRSAKRLLSPATLTILDGEPDLENVEDNPKVQQERIQRWRDLAQRFERLESSVKTLDEPPKGSTTPRELEERMQVEIDKIDELESTLYHLQNLQRQRARFSNLKENLRAADFGGLTASTVLLALILDSKGIDVKNIRNVSEIFENQAGLNANTINENTIGRWRNVALEKLGEKFEELTEQRDRLKEIGDREQLRREIRTEIRSKTEDYLSLVDEVHYCPACYIKQGKPDILEREEPEVGRHPDDFGSVETLSEEINELERAIEILEEPNWLDVEHAVEQEYADFCGIKDLLRLLDIQYHHSIGYTIPEGSTSEDIDVLVDTLESIFSSGDEVSPNEVVADTIERLGKEIADLRDEIEEWEASRDIDEVINYHKQRREKLRTGLDMLGNLWSGNGTTHTLNFYEDRKIIRETIEDVKQKPPKLDLTEDIKKEIHNTKSKKETFQQDIEEHEQNIDRLKSAFEGAGGEGELEDLVQEHMTIVSTLFMAFQRPYEFKEVQLNDDGSVSVMPRDEGKEVSFSSISSGQRAALALAIFVTNNLAHTTAPPLMMLDEPFAYLDDINIVSFFNLLIELTHRRERQIIFATASQDIADLLERKAGSSDQFKRVRLPTTSAEIQSK